MWEINVKNALLILSLAFVAGPDDPKTDYHRFEGTWIMVYAKENGKEPGTEFVKKSRLVVKGKEHTVTLGDMTHKATHKLDPTKNPKTIDIKRDDGVELEGIYELKDGVFTI